MPQTQELNTSRSCLSMSCYLLLICKIPYAGLTAWSALVSNDALKHEGASVLIVGASGGVGTFAIQLLKYLKCQVSAICSTKHIELVKSLGCDSVYDYTQNQKPKEVQCRTLWSSQVHRILSISFWMVWED